MSEGLLRRNSGKQGLQNLIRLTAQRSAEDAEEVERERRRRAREDVGRRTGRAHHDHALQAKAGGSPSPEEDEGFGDWTRRREQTGQRRLPEVGGRAEEERRGASAAESEGAGREESPAGPHDGQDRRRRRDEASRVKSSDDDDGDGETLGPVKTPAHKITERTESFHRSLKKSNSFKKTPALVLTSNMDDKMEQYAHAVENSREPHGSKASVADLPDSPEAVTSRKSLFEAREAWTGGPPKTTSCRDADGLRVGVANLITRWVKGQPDGGRPPHNPSGRESTKDVKCGDVMQKKNMWEVLGDSSGRSAANAKGSGASSKKFKFVVTGHGKYEKISLDQEHAMNGKSDSRPGDY
ncbi:lymphocyte-specific protein 1 [Syngnathoides biaculeatus]|uniref:lymphocyte-specific protein 1 n=1 Tax=Syngnathoides biaculeatus TaxID=300417 RepID=UPI002ADE443A|nr:lymphocyte-specific protein 1 [Syngnathoides biaculeatus]